MDIEFVVLGEPVAKQRPRVSVRNGYAHAYTPDKTLNYESRVAYAYKDVSNGYVFDRNDLLSVSITAYFSLNKSDYGKKGLNKSGRYKMEQIFAPTKKDIDNLCKSVLDGLNGVAYLDDKQVVMLVGIKKWTEDNPRIEVHIGKIRNLKDISTSST